MVLRLVFLHWVLDYLVSLALGVSGAFGWSFLGWISEFPTNRVSISVKYLQPKPALIPRTLKKEETLSEAPCWGWVLPSVLL
jgi:hypothetical protein